MDDSFLHGPSGAVGPATLALISIDEDPVRGRMLTAAQRAELGRRIVGEVESHTRGGDRILPISDGQIVLVMAETDAHDTFLIAERLRERIRSLHLNPDLVATLSHGVAPIPPTSDAARALEAAGQALITARLIGHDAGFLFNHELVPILDTHLSWADGDPPGAERLLGLARALDARDGTEVSHADSVGDLAAAIGAKLGLEPDRTERLRLAGLLHDIGKAAVPDTILRKPGPLDDAEWEAMRRHAEIGARMITSDEFADVRDWVHSSHERFDGRGYPRGLMGHELDIEARIVAIADAYDAMTTDRVYRKALPEKVAREELERCAGGQFDPEVTVATLEVLAQRDRAQQEAAAARE